MSSKLILMRHGRSAWNKQNLFTGWVDIPLDEGGIAESIAGGKKIQNIPIDVVFTSTLIRAQMTVVLALMNHSSGKVPVFLDSGDSKQENWSKIYGDHAMKTTLPVHRAWELNERYYGQLQGLDKAETAKEYGADQVQIWRRSFDVRPPEGESLEDTTGRTLPYFKNHVVPLLERGQNVFIAAHGNSLRSIIMDLDQLSEDQVVSLEIPTGEPIVYTYERGKWLKST